jgi:CPA2 family monovalent cation:H+ antiporter-2
MVHSPHLQHIVIFLCAAVLVVAVFRVIRLSPVIGYLAAGAAIGPFGLRFITEYENTAGIAEFGVIFLLFLIGIELSLARLRSMRKHVFEFGGAQMLVTAGLFGVFFVVFDGSAPAAIIIGGGMALSSTAIVLQVIAEQGEKSSQVGRLALAILILQDLAVIPLLVLVPLLGEHTEPLLTALTEAGLKAALCLGIIFVAGRLLLRPLFHFIASLDNTELFTAATLAVVLGVAWLTSMAGLSPALGAFLAGLLVAETEFKPQVESDILPFKGLFLGLFFMTVGMSLNLDMLWNHFASIIGLSVGLMAGKAIILIGISRLFGFSLGTALHLGLLLSQGSEFAFILFSLADSQHILDPSISQILQVVITVSMALTPVAAHFGRRLALTLDKPGAQDDAMSIETLDLRHHVIISGYGRVGHTVGRILEMENIRFVAIDMDSLLVARERKIGTPVYYGDTTRLHVMNALGLSRARALIITHSDTRVALQTIATAREVNQSLPIIVRAKNIEQVQKLETAGANLAVAEMFETSLQLGGALLKSLGVAEYEIGRLIDIFRAQDYALTRESERENTAAP